jgi:hypothetical protein
VVVGAKFTATPAGIAERNVIILSAMSVARMPSWLDPTPP